jgi:hypothetical protein
VGQRLVQPQLVADHHQRGTERRAQVAHGLLHERVELRLVDLGGRLLIDSHRCTS